MVALRTIVFVVLFMGSVLLYVPYLLVSGAEGASRLALGLWRLAGLAPLALGVAGVAWCVRDFTVVGRGTPAPFDPPRTLVASGLYRWVRNPMYLSALLLLLGEAVLLGAPVLLEYAAGFAVVAHVFVMLYEEPTLRRKFGDSYDRYRATVPRWIPRRPPRGGVLAMLLGLGVLGASAPSLRAQVPVPQPAEPLPQGDVFRPLIADPKQPHFFASWLWTRSPLITSQVASVGLGEDIGLIRGRGGRWQVSVAAGVFSQFNMETKSNDLINTDFVIGFPLTYERGPYSARARVYHQSSHLGDEFILNNNPTRVNLSFEALELLASRDFGEVRVYGGGEYLFRHEPADLKPGLFHWGVEGRLPGTVVRLGGLGGGRLILALDAKSSQERKWQTGWGARAGLEFLPAGMSPEARRRLSVQLQAYDGPAPYGQFYLDNVRSVGLGVHFSL